MITAPARGEHAVAPPRRSRPADVLLFVAAVAIVGVTVLARVWGAGGDPSVLLSVGDRSASRSLVEHDLPDPVLIPGYGHDGQQFYVIARTFPHLDRADGHVDRLGYRARRILFPLAVSAFPAGAATVWAMAGVNLAAAGMAAVALGRMARRVGLPGWAGIAAALSPAVVISARASLADGMAFALALWGLVLWRRHVGWAAVLFALAALAREQALMVPLACLVVTMMQRPRPRVAALLVPFGVYLGWAVAVGRWLQPVRSGGEPNAVADVLRSFDLPFQAWFTIGLRDPAVLLGVALVVGCVAAAWALRDLLPEAAVWVGLEAVLVVISAPAVSGDLLNYARVAPFAVPAVALGLGVSAARARRTPAGAHR